MKKITKSSYMLVDDDDDDDDDGQASWEDEKGLRHVNNHSPVHMLVVVNTQQKGGLPDQSVTFVEQGEHPLLIGVQISHRVCPFQSYAESANHIHFPFII